MTVSANCTMAVTADTFVETIVIVIAVTTLYSLPDLNYYGYQFSFFL